MCGAVPGSNEVDGLGIGPDESIDVAVELLGHVCLLARLDLIDTEAVAVALVSVALHALPSHVLAVGRERGVGVVAEVVVAAGGGRVAEAMGGHEHRVALEVRVVCSLVLQGACIVVCGSLVACGFAEVGGVACLRVVEEDVGVGGYGVFASCLLPAGVGHIARVGTPCELFHAAEGLHWALERLVAKYGLALAADLTTLERVDIGLWDGLHPLVPVAVHQFVDHIARGLGQVLGFLGDGAGVWVGVDDQHFLAVGREEIVFHVAVQG